MDLKITPSGQTIVKPTALGPVANTDTELLIYGLFQKGRVLAQDDQKIVVTLNETIRIMAKVDEVIEAQGGWPDAFSRAYTLRPV